MLGHQEGNHVGGLLLPSASEGSQAMPEKTPTRDEIVLLRTLKSIYNTCKIDPNNTAQICSEHTDKRSDIHTEDKANKHAENNRLLKAVILLIE